MGQALDVVTRFYKLFNEGNLDGASALFKPGLLSYEPSIGQMKGVEAWRAHSEAFRSAMPDARLELDSSVEDGDRLAVAGRFTGTHTAALSGPQGEIPASGNRIELHFADFFEFDGPLIAGHRVYYDQLELMGQLGLAPAAAG